MPFNSDEVSSLLESRTAFAANHLYALLYAPAVAVNMYQRLVPVFQTDAAHCSGKTKGTLFSFYGSDANRRMVLISLMFVCDKRERSHMGLIFGICTGKLPPF